MALRAAPSKPALAVLATGTVAVLLSLLAGLPVSYAWVLAITWLAALLGVAGADYRMTLLAWRQASPRMRRSLPPVLMRAGRQPVRLTLEADGEHIWRIELHDHADPNLLTDHLPARAHLPGGRRLELVYEVTPTRRGDVTFAPAEIRVHSRLGLCELFDHLGGTDLRRVYPDLAHAVLDARRPAERRAAAIGIQSYRQRGEGTEFKQLSPYQAGTPVRHVDWKASRRSARPVVREFQDESAQCVLLLVDCGHPHAHESHPGAEPSRFDQMLNAVMLLAQAVLMQGDALGVMTFGAPTGAERYLPPRKGMNALKALIGELYALQPTPARSDPIAAAKALLSRHRKRSLVMVVTDFGKEAGSEFGQCRQMLQSRHRVMIANLREALIGQRPAANGTLEVDANPARLGVALVNRYHAAKRSGPM